MKYWKVINESFSNVSWIVFFFNLTGQILGCHQKGAKRFKLHCRMCHMNLNLQNIWIFIHSCFGVSVRSRLQRHVLHYFIYLVVFWSTYIHVLSYEDRLSFYLHTCRYSLLYASHPMLFIFNFWSLLTAYYSLMTFPWSLETPRSHWFTLLTRFFFNINSCLFLTLQWSLSILHISPHHNAHFSYFSAYSSQFTYYSSLCNSDFSLHIHSSSFLTAHYSLLYTFHCSFPYAHSPLLTSVSSLVTS